MDFRHEGPVFELREAPLAGSLQAFAGCTGQAQAPHTALWRRCPFQKSELATSSPPTGDIKLSGNGPNHPASAAIHTAKPSEATAQTARRP